MTDWSRIPVELRERPQWCLAGDDKSPRTVDGRAASVTDPTTWADFDAVSHAAAARGCGVGYVQTADDPFSCIDMDVKDGTAPEALSRYQAIIERFDSFTEHSQSGRGFHVWVKGKIGDGKRRDGVEVYSQKRFMICTGNVVRDQPIAERQALLTNMVAQMAPEPPADVVLDGDSCADWGAATRAAEDGGELGKLFSGDWQGRYESQSEADLALVKLLLPLTLSTRECWLTFRLSKLGERDKAKRIDYAEKTMALAVQHLANDAASVQHGQAMADGLFWQAPPPRNQRHFRLFSDGDLDRLPPLRWLVKRIIPDAGIGAIFGPSGTFKSFLTFDLLAHISNGSEWFENRVRAAPAVYVPFEGQGGVPNRVKAWRLAQAMQRNPDMLMMLAPPDDVRSHVAVIMEPINLREQADRDILVATLTEQGWAGGVLCIDTLAHASAGLDENSSAMAEMISIFRDLQQRLGGVILLVHHSGKDASRGMRGWSGLHAAMDFVIECQRDEDSAALAAEFVLTKVKDGTSGTRTPFVLQPVQIGIDEDGDHVSSLVVAPAQQHEVQKVEHPFSTDADDADDDQFVWEWVKREAEQGAYPSGRSLEGQRANQMGQERKLSQVRLRDAIHRLRAASRLVDADEKAPSGNVYLVAV
jgi:RecA-family ATPase